MGPSDEEVEETKIAMKKLQAYWETAKISVTPKAHAFFVHGIDQMERFDGIADKVEDFLEKAHQTGKKLNNLTVRMPQKFEQKQRTQI